jgi:homoprotocatechuate degradation regulator HpaR
MKRWVFVSTKTRSRTVKTVDTPMKTLSKALPMQLLRAREAVMQRFRPHLHELGFTDQQGRIIRTLADVDWIDMLELSRRCCIHPASLSRIIPRLDEKGIVRRRQAPDDARRVAVSLTKKGRATFDILSFESEVLYADLAAELGGTRLQELHRCLDALIEILGGAEVTVPDEQGGET